MPAEKKHNKINFLPDIEEYLESIDDNLPVMVDELEEIIENVAAHTNLSKEQTEIIVREYFQVIRNLMLRGQRVTLKKLGCFMIANPGKGNRRRVFPKFKASKVLLRKLNENV